MLEEAGDFLDVHICIRSGIAFILGEHHMCILSFFAYCQSNVCRVKGHKQTHFGNANVYW
jgi:hypothetical protein